MHITINGKVKASQSVPSKRICSTLENNSSRYITLHNFQNDLQQDRYNFITAQWENAIIQLMKSYRLEEPKEAPIVYSISKRNIYGIEFAFSFSNILEN